MKELVYITLRSTSTYALTLIIGTLIVSICFEPFTKASIDRVTLFPSDDSYTVSSSSFTNYGGEATLNVSRHEDFESVNEVVMWLRFNLSSVPDGAVITSATLQLYCLFVSEVFNVSAHFCSENNWSEVTLTFDNQPTYNATMMPVICQTCGSKSWALVNSSERWYFWDVTYSVNRTVDGFFGGEGVVTVILRENLNHQTLTSATFHSKEGNIGYHPALKVTWSHIVPELPTSAVIFFIAVTLFVASLKVKHRTRKKPPT